MRAVDILRTKRDGGELTAEQIRAFVSAAATGGWPDYQLSALLMAIFLKGMTAAETATLTRAMADSGKVLDLSDIPGVKVDKHSTGGVGDKVSLVLAPLAASCGVTVPMMSGHGLGHTGGTLDKLEAIPGFRTNLNEDELRAALRTVGCGMIGQSADVAPADKKLYALRDVTSTVESIPLITASILSKKIAEGISALVMDVKCGRGAFMKTLPEAKALAESIQRVGTANGLTVRTLITDMDTPLGRAVGHSLEVIEAIETLKGHGPADLTELCVRQAALMVELSTPHPVASQPTSPTRGEVGVSGLSGQAPFGETRSPHLPRCGGGRFGAEQPNRVGGLGETNVREALASGAALDKFRRMVEQQGGDPRVVDDYSLLPTAPHRTHVLAPADGFVSDIDPYAVGVAVAHLGGGRKTATDHIDLGVGVIVKKKRGDAVKASEPVFEVHHGGTGLAEATELLWGCFRISDSPPAAKPLVLEELG